MATTTEGGAYPLTAFPWNVEKPCLFCGNRSERDGWVTMRGTVGDLFPRVVYFCKRCFDVFGRQTCYDEEMFRLKIRVARCKLIRFRAAKRATRKFFRNHVAPELLELFLWKPEGALAQTLFESYNNHPHYAAANKKAAEEKQVLMELDNFEPR